MACFSLMSYVDRTVLSIAAAPIIKELGISQTRMGTVFSAFLLSYTLLMVPGGWLADHIGPRRVLGLLGAGAAVFTGLTPLAGAPLAAASFGACPCC